MAEADFADLRKLADALGALETRTLRAAASRAIQQLAKSLDTLAIPLLARTLRDASPVTREAAREALAALATERSARARVLDALRALIEQPASDDAKVCVLGLLAELGAPTAAKFSDPLAIQRRSALALAAQLETPSDLANAADMMVRTLDDRDVVQMIELLVEVAPAAAHRLAGELALRLDVDRERRAKIAAIVGAHPRTLEAVPVRTTRPTHVAVLVDAAARIVVVATRKHAGERTWRRWAVLIGESGCIEDCLHEETTPTNTLDPSASLIANLCADGYRVASSELDHAHTLVATAARRTVRADVALGSSYYLGRDLLDLGAAHLIAPIDPLVAPEPVLAKAIELLAGGDAAAARRLFERCPAELATSTDWAAGYGACLLALGDHAAAVAPLERAIAGEPSWPLHHWNLASALHAIGESRGCLAALRHFTTTSGAQGALADDVDQPARLTRARLLIAELERIARLDNTIARRRPSVARGRASKKRKKPAR